MACATKVTIGGGGTRVAVQGGTAKRITLDARTAAVIADRRPQTVTQPRNTQVDVTSKPTTVTAGSGMGVQGPQGPAGVDVGSTPTISAESDEPTLLLKGMPVALVGNKLRRASAIAPFNEVVGLVLDENVVQGTTARVQTGGTLSQPVASWEAATGIPGALAVNAIYFLAPSPSGSMSPWPPTAPNHFVAPVGRAASATEFIIDIDTQVLL